MYSCSISLARVVDGCGNVAPAPLNSLFGCEDSKCYICKRVNFLSKPWTLDKEYEIVWANGDRLLIDTNVSKYCKLIEALTYQNRE